jgi:hypothetical protein
MQVVDWNEEQINLHEYCIREVAPPKQYFRHVGIEFYREHMV